MKTRFYNARILPFVTAEAALVNGELWVEEDRITLVGEANGKTAPKWDREIDCKGNLLMPGFKNAHTHSGMTFLRSLADDKPLHQWLHEDVFPLEALLEKDDIYYLTALAVMEYVSSGMTASFDMYYRPELVAQCAIDTGYRIVMCGSANDFGGTKESLRREYDTYNNLHPLVSMQLGFHAEYTTSLSLLKDIADLAHEYRIPVFTHNSETLSETEDCKKRTGMTPTQYLDSLGMFDFGGGGFHCVYFDEADIALAKKRGLYVCTNPGSNVKLSSGIAPIQELYDAEVPVAIGTDGPASNNCLDFFREMFLVAGLQKLKNGADSTDANRILNSACSVGARMMGLKDCDCLQEGKQADLVMIDLHRPNMQPLNNITKNVVYSGSKENVKLTMVRGKILYENGEFHIGLEPEAVYEKANAIVERIRKASGR